MLKPYIFFIIITFIRTNFVFASIFYVTSNADSGVGSLRNAIIEANKKMGKDSIYFNIPLSSVEARRITLQDTLQPILDTLIIDGTTQEAGNAFGKSNAKIGINVTSLQNVNRCLDIFSTNCEIYGLWIDRTYLGILAERSHCIIGAPGKGNVITGETFAISLNLDSAVIIQGNIIGADTIGSVAMPNFYGVYSVTSYGLIIGGSKKGSGNLFAGEIQGSKGVILAYNRDIFIKGNYFGTNSLSGINLGNNVGVWLAYDTNVVIGGRYIEERNIVSENDEGISVWHCKRVVIQGNYVGTDVTGTKALGNKFWGIGVGTNSDSVWIGGSRNKNEGNIISGNGEGIDIGSSKRIVVQGNKIGTDTSGNQPLPNLMEGMYIYESSKILIGSTVASHSNIIAHNNGPAVTCIGDDKLISIVQNNIFCNYTGIFMEESYGKVPNMGIEPPELTFVNSRRVEGTSAPKATIEIFQNNLCNSCEGAKFIGGTLANSLGNWTFSGNIPFRITATQTDTLGNTSSFAECMDSIGCTSIHANFFSKENLCTNDSIKFTDESKVYSGSHIKTWNWSFGDSSFSTKQNPKHLYTKRGTYQVMLKVENSDGCADTFSRKIVIHLNSSASFDFSENGPLFSFVNTSFPNDSSSFYWTFGDGATSTEENPSHAYQHEGIYKVCLSVYDSACLSTDTTCDTLSFISASSNSVLNNSTIIVTPNPSSSTFRIFSLNPDVKITSVTVLSLLGQEQKIFVTSGEQPNALQLKIDSKESGMRILRITTDKGVFNKKITLLLN
jgi:parallel beta-helix repeat protein